MKARSHHFLNLFPTAIIYDIGHGAATALASFHSETCFDAGGTRPQLVIRAHEHNHNQWSFVWRAPIVSVLAYVYDTHVSIENGNHFESRRESYCRVTCITALGRRHMQY